MEENQNKKKNSKVLAVIAIATLLVGVIGATYAYFVGQIGGPATANVTLTTGTNDVVTFSAGSAITIGPVTQANFGEGAGDKSGSTTATAKLKANNQANVPTNSYCYQAYLTVSTNTFAYTVNSSTPELLLNVTKNGTAVITNKDITTGTATVYFPTANNGTTYKHTFAATTKNTTTTDTFNVTVTFKNLSTDQSSTTGTNNTGKTFTGVIHIENVACS